MRSILKFRRSIASSGWFVLLVVMTLSGSALLASDRPTQKRNVIIFVADGLRRESVNKADAPTLWGVRQSGVDFPDSHAAFPTTTMPNAAAIAEGRNVADNGVFGNTLFVGYPLFDTGNFRMPIGTPTPFLENNLVLADLLDHKGNFAGYTSLLGVARRSGYATAVAGGPFKPSVG